MDLQEVDHIGQNGRYGIKALGRCTDIVQTRFLQKNLLDNKSGNGFGKFRSCFHDSQTKRNDFGAEEEANNLRVIHLDECTYDTQTCQSQILERPRFALCVQERIEIQRYLRRQKWLSGIGMRCDALQQCQCIADTVGRVGGQGRRSQQWVNGDDFLQECRDGARRVPQNRSQIGEGFSLFGQFQEDHLAAFRIRQLQHQRQQFVHSSTATGPISSIPGTRRKRMGRAVSGGSRCHLRLVVVSSRWISNGKVVYPQAIAFVVPVPFRRMLP
mmetsp:Transcript_22030/g.46430  ORF Transcript_22030/g.46430 Transcript_22030/m.46430 type:complete len:271 (-) Transcript_22030:252-1064(-)